MVVFCVWRVASNILNIQKRTADRGRPSSFGVERGPHDENLTRYEYSASKLGGYFGG